MPCHAEMLLVQYLLYHTHIHYATNTQYVPFSASIDNNSELSYSDMFTRAEGGGPTLKTMHKLKTTIKCSMFTQFRYERTSILL